MDYRRWDCEINVFMRWKVNIVQLITLSLCGIIFEKGRKNCSVLSLKYILTIIFCFLFYISPIPR